MIVYTMYNTQQIIIHKANLASQTEQELVSASQLQN